MMRHDLWAVLPVAGRSRRMQEYKPLLALGECTILEQTIRQFQKAGIHKIIVVTGHRREQLLPVLTKMGVQEVYNPDYRACDMLCSVKTGIRAALKWERVDGVFVSPGDIPLIRPSTILAVAEKYLTKGEPVVVPCFYGKRGHPPLFSGETAARLLKYDGDGGLKGFLASLTNVERIETADSTMMLDADTPEDYIKLQNAYRYWEIPDEETSIAIWNCANTPEAVRRHCRKVADTGLNAGRRVLEQVPEQKREWFLRLLQAGALLHDVMRASPNHEEEGARFLRSMGYDETAEIVESHRVPGEEGAVWNGRMKHELKEVVKGILYCSDRLTEDDWICNYEERYEKKRRDFEGNKDALRTLERDKRQFEHYRGWLKELVGYDLFE